VLFFPNAKINIGLNITSKRGDGYHNLESIFYPIGWKDALEIMPSESLTFQSSGIPIPGDGNLCLKAYEVLKRHYPIEPVAIHLHKNIPIGAGLGGGSSDAAFTLMGLNTIFNLNLDKSTLKELAVQVGADCPFFIDNVPSLARGIGEVLKPVDLDLTNYHLMVVKPKVFVSTAEAFSAIVPQENKTPLDMEAQQDINRWALKNDFEKSVFPLYPELQDIKNKLLEAGALYASMSGSGSSIYGVFSEKPMLEFKNSTVFYQPL